MARRNDNTREELKHMAIASGLKILDENGLSGLSARKVTRAMGYTIGTLYQMFNNYDDLILHMRAAVLDDLQLALGSAVRPGRSVRRNIESLAAAYLAFARDSYPRWHILFSHDDPGSQLPPWYQAKLNALFLIIEQALLPLTRQAREEAKILWAGVHGICVLSVTQKLERVGSEPAEALIGRFLRNYMRALNKGE